MRDAAVERLAKLISESSSDDEPRGDGYRSRKPIEVHIRLEEGWFSLFLVATVVYSTIWSVQAVQWVDHLNVLSLTTVLGLIAGVLAAKQQRFSRVAVHVVAICFGVVLAFWQTAGAFFNGNTPALVHGIQSWFKTVVIQNGTGADDFIFLFFILALGFILAYTSAWLVYRTRSPWLMIVANAVVLLINLSAVPEGYIIFLVVFLMASLLLLLRFNLYESVKRWQKQGLRYADDIGWDIMQAGALVSIGILILSWVLPFGYVDTNAALVWSSSANPWVQAQDFWNRAVSVTGGINPANRGNFRDTLVLAGNPNLNNDIVFVVQSTDGTQYLESVSYDTYSDRGWTVGSAATQAVPANLPYTAAAISTKALKQTITVVNPPGEQYPYLFGASQVTTTNVKTKVWENQATGEVVAWENQGGYLTVNTRYSVTSSISVADLNTLRSIPLPKDAPQTVSPAYENADLPLPPEFYNPNIVNTYTQYPKELDPRIAALAREIVTRAHAKNMYDMTVALEDYLRTNYRYSTDITRPPGEDGVAWFLFDNQDKKGFCNYFASAMTLMARSLGIPARVVAGYTNGDLDPKHSNQRIIRGKDAHSWTQIYFARYGWVNFEPSSGFATFVRPIHTTPDANDPNVGNVTGPLAGKKLPRAPELNDSGNAGASTKGQGTGLLGQQIGMTLGGLILLVLFGCILFGLWWNRLFRRYSLAAQLYGRVCMLANWAGIELRSSQTPYECVRELAVVAPQEATPLERIGDIYVREQWADPESMEHPRRNGEVSELPGIWKNLQPRLFLFVVRHPYILGRVPLRVWNFVSGYWRQRRAKKLAEEEI